MLVCFTAINNQPQTNMKKLILLLAFVCSAGMQAQKIVTQVSSPRLKENREITIGLPASYDKNPDKKYPLLVLLDGDYLFDPFQGALNYGNYWEDLPEVIIVGISQNKNNEREIDCAVDEATGLPAESGEKFFEFISLGVIPYMQQKYRISPFKMIAGHDTTAGFMNFYLYKEDPLFTGYISLSPGLAQDMETHIPERLAAITKPIFYYQSTADGDVRKMQQRIRDLDKGIKAAKKESLNYGFDDFKGATHYSLVLHSIPNALYQFFAAYQPISMNEFNEKIAILPSGYVDYLANKYDVMEKALSMKIPIRINDFKAIEAAILKNKAYQEFDKLSDMARKSYPKSMLADYQLGMMYEKMGENKKALKAYQVAYQKEEIGDLTKDLMLDKIDQLKNQ